MLPTDYTIDHIGIAVKDINQAIENYTTNFGHKLVLKETLEYKQIDLAFVSTGNTMIEFISPTTEGKKDENHTVQKFLNSRGEGLHHICYEVSDIHQELSRLEKSGLILIDKTPRAGAFGSKIAFLHPKLTNGTLIELCQK